MAEHEKKLLDKIEVVFGSRESCADPAPKLLRSNASALAIDLASEEQFPLKILEAVGTFILIFGFFLWARLEGPDLELIAQFSWPNILAFLGLLAVRLAMLAFTTFLWIQWVKLVVRLVSLSRVQLRLFMLALPVALGSFLGGLSFGMPDSNFLRWLHALLDGVFLSASILSAFVVVFGLMKAAESILRHHHRRVDPVKYLIYSLFETLYELQEIPKGGALDFAASEKRAAILDNLEGGALSLQAVSRLGPTNDKLFESWKRDAFDRRVQALRELKMAIILPKADTRDWLEQELLRMLRLLAAGDLDGFPVNKYDLKKLESFLRRLSTVGRSLLIPLIVLGSFYLAYDHIPPEVKGNLAVIAWGYALVSVVGLIDPRFVEKVSALKDLPNILSIGNRKTRSPSGD